MVGGSKRVRGRKNRRKAMNHAPRNAVTLHQTRRRRPSLAALGAGPTLAMPPACAALEVPTAGVPTYFVASAPPAAGDFAASGLGLTVSDSGAAMQNLLDFLSYSKLLRGGWLSAGLSPCALALPAPLQMMSAYNPVTAF